MAVPLTLKIFKGESLIASRDYDRDIIKIGRLASAHLCLDDDKVSRIHSVIDSSDGKLSIIDMGSVEGTYVNGKRVNKGNINFGDVIRVGGTTIQVHEVVANLQQAAAASTDSIDEPATPSGIPLSAVEGLADAAHGQTEMNGYADEPPEPEPVAMDSSFASTQRNESVPHETQEAEPAPRVRPARKKGSGPVGLELSLMWGDQRVGEFFLRPGKSQSFTVGSAAGVDFVMGDSELGGKKFKAISSDGKTFTTYFTGKMSGELIRRGETMDLRQVIERGLATSDGDAYGLSLESDDFVWVDLGGIVLEASFQPTPKPVWVPFKDTVDFTMLNIFLLMFFLGAAFVITAMNREVEGDEYADELNNSEARIAKLIIKPPDVEKNNSLLQKLAEQKSGEAAAKHRDTEGQMGKRDAKKRDAHAAPQGDPSKKDQARAMIGKVFGSGKGGISTIFGSGGLGGELRSAMGNMFGSSAGDSQGFGGLGLRGSGGGGGGMGDTIGIGAIGTRGRGGGTGSYGTGVGVIGGKKSVDIGITSSDPEVMGSLDKELIRQVIHRNRNQIRYCYESQLNRFPKLNGKVAVKFVITANGNVSLSNVAQATTNNPELETCVAGRVHTWIFPKPKGGGVVVVTYPFIFKQSGD